KLIRRLEKPKSQKGFEWTVSANGKQVALWEKSTTLRLLSGESGEERWRIQLDKSDNIFFGFLPDGKTLVYGLYEDFTMRRDPEDQSLIFLDVDSGREIRRWSHRPNLAGFVFAPDSSPDRSTVALDNGVYIDIVDAVTGKSTVAAPRLPQ